MAVDKIQVGKQFMADLLARIPEDQRESVGALLHADDVVAFAGDAAIRQSDYSRQMNELSDYRKTLDDWYAKNEALLKSAANPNPHPKPAGTPAGDPATFSREEVTALINEREAGVASYVAHVNALTLKHLQTFNEVLDLNALMADPEIKSRGLLGVYDKTFAPRYAEKAKAATEAEVTRRVNEGVAEARKSFHTQVPYPVNPSMVSPLDALTAASPQDGLVDKAVAEYNELVAKKLGVPA